MVIASMVVRAAPGKAHSARQQLESLPALTLYPVNKDDTVIAVAEANDAKELEQISMQILQASDDILGVYPAYMTSEETAAA